MRYLFLITLFLFVQFAFSQNLPIVWQGCFGGSEPDKAKDVIELEDGYLIVGVARSDDGDVSYLHGGDDGWLIKTDFEGNLLWEKTFGGTNGDGFNRIFPSGDGYFYLIGGSSSSDGDISYDPYPGSTDFWILKIDGSGNILWDKIVGGNMLEQIWTGAATSDGGVVALGWTGSNDGDISNWYGLYDIWMVKLNSEGEVVADVSLGTSSFDWGVAMIETSDGGFLLGGGSGVGTGGNITCEPYGSDYSDAVLFKLDADLNIEWQSCYGGTDDDVVSGMLEVEDGYILLIGTYSNDGDVSGWHGGSDIWLVRIDFDGNIIWQNCLGGSYNESSQIILKLENENIMIIGSTESQDGDVVGNHSQSEYSNDIWLVKLSGEGELLWQQCIGGLGNEETYFGAIKKSDTDFVIAGQFNKGPSFDVGCTPFGVFADMPDVWIFEVKDTTTTVTNNESIITNKLKVYPNPARDYVVFDLPASVIKPAVIPKNAVISTHGEGHGAGRRPARLRHSGGNPPATSWNTGNPKGNNNSNNRQGMSHAGAQGRAQMFDMTAKEGAVVVIVDIFGQRVAELPVTKDKTVWNTDKVEDGIYFYRIEIEGEVLSGKVVVQK